MTINVCCSKLPHLAHFVKAAWGTNMSGEEQDVMLAFGVMGPRRGCGQGLQRAVGCLGRRTKLYNRAEMVMVQPLYPENKL